MFSESYSSPPDTACFSCNGSQFLSYLKSGYFQKVLDSKLTVQNNHAYKLFGKMVTNSSVFTNLQHLFMDIKRNFSVLKGVALEKDDSFKKEFISADTETLRMDILKVFHILSANIQALNARHNTTLLLNNREENNHFKIMMIQLIKEIKNLLLDIGRIYTINGINNPRDFTYTASKSAINFYHYYHLCLDIWFNCASLLYIICFLYPVNVDGMFCDFFDQPSPFLQVAYFLVYELSYLAISNYRSAHISSNSPFNCPCVKEFWILSINLIDKFSACNEKVSFWNTYLSSLQIILKNSKSQSPKQDLVAGVFSVIDNPLDIQNPVEACLWLTSHIAPLYKYNAMGEFFEHNKAKSGYAVGKYLVHNLLSLPVAKEKALRIALSFCMELVKIWEPSCDMLLPLTDFFIKKIEETFNVQGIDLSYLFKDAVSWLTHINNLSNVSLNNETSFDQFLCILHLQLALDPNKCLWRSLKGRIYIRFTPKKIKELSEVGLQNLFSLFHIIVSSGQLEIVDKLCEVATIIETVRNHRKQIISWKALFVLLHIFQEKRLDAEKITTIFSNFFNSVCSDYSKVSRDSSLKSNLMSLLLVYIDNLGELFKKSNCQNLFSYQLLSKGFTDLLPACGVTEGNYILSVVLSILQKIQEILFTKPDCIIEETGCIRILQSILGNIYPYIESVAVSDTTPLVVSDIAANLTKLTFDFSSLINDISFDFLRIFIYFACKEIVSSSITCHYLNFILDYPTLLDEIKLKLKDFEVLIFQSWIKCIICTPAKNDSIRELTQKVLRQHVITQLYSNTDELTFEESDHVTMAMKLFELFGNAFSRCSQDEKVKMAHRMQQLFKSYATVAQSKIKKDKEGPTLSHLYKLTSSLVEHCSPALHLHVTYERILLNILDQTVYPQILFPKDKAMQYLVLCSIKDHLNLFMRGLFKLDYRKDKSIEREIRDIFICYTIMLPTSGNPLIKLVVDSVCRKPGALTLDTYHFILEISKQSLLSNNVEKPMSVFEFYHEIFKQVPSSCKKEISSVLLKCAMEIYMKQNDSLTEYLKTLIKNVLVCFKDKIVLSHSKIILIPVIQWFIQEKLQWSVVRGFNILNTFVEYVPQVMSDVVPFLTKSVETLEKSRGHGEDVLLRNGLKNVITLLQRK